MKYQSPRTLAVIAGTLALTAGALACGGSSPAAPSRASASLSGRVLDGDNQAVAGARITAAGTGAGPIAVISDAQGLYALPLGAHDRTIQVLVEKDGFEPSRLEIPPQEGQASRDLRLYAITRLTAGDSVRLELWRDSPLCDSDAWEGPLPCRPVRVTSTRSGELWLGTADALGDFSPLQDVVIQRRGAGSPSSSLQFDVASGSEEVVEILLLGDSSQTLFLLTEYGPF